VQADAAEALEIRRIEAAPALPLRSVGRQFRGEGARLAQ
jgi:hypothetical protein